MEDLIRKICLVNEDMSVATYSELILSMFRQVDGQISLSVDELVRYSISEPLFVVTKTAFELMREQQRTPM